MQNAKLHLKIQIAKDERFLFVARITAGIGLYHNLAKCEIPSV